MTRGLVKPRPSWNTLAVVLIAAVAGVVRFWNLGSLGYAHWDEYYFIKDAQRFSQYWPAGLRSMSWVETPLVPFTDGTLFHLLGNQAWIPFAMSALYGTLSAVALYWLGSRLFGNMVGLLAAAILATAEYSVMYSRMALAESTFEFWLIISVLLVWIAFERGQLRYYVLAGISNGLLLNTKYDGAFVLLVAGTWFAVESVIEVVGKRATTPRTAWSVIGPRLKGLIVMGGIALAMFVPFLVKLVYNPGLQVVLGHHGEFEGLFVTSPKIILWYFWLLTSAPTVLIAIAGLAIGLIRLTRADRIMLVHTAIAFTALMMYAAYPREGLVLWPAAAIWAARAITEVAKLLSGVRIPIPGAGIALAGAVAAVVLVAQVLPLPQLLSLRTQSYADAGAVAAGYQATGGHLFVHAQDCAYLYVHGFYNLQPSPTTIRLLSEAGPDIYFLTDERIADELDFFALNHDHLEVVARVPNQLYPEVFLQPATEQKLSSLDRLPDYYRYITIWRVTGTLVYPPSWTSTG